MMFGLVTASTQEGINTLFPILAKEKRQWFKEKRNHTNQEDRKGKKKSVGYEPGCLPQAPHLCQVSR